MKTHYLTLPVDEASVRALHIGDIVYLTGDLFTLRDMGHLRLRELMNTGAQLPKNFIGGAIFHAGPVTHRDEAGDWHLNVIGPTTSIRMEPHARTVGELQVRMLIGKGGMGESTEEAASSYGYVYLQAAPGCAAKLSEGVERINDVLWLDMGMPEALWELHVKDFGPFVVGMDSHGRSIYRELRESAYCRLNTLYPQECV